MTIPRVVALQTYWRRFPPPQIALAALLGIKPKRGGDLAELARLMAAATE